MGIGSIPSAQKLLPKGARSEKMNRMVYACSPRKKGGITQKSFPWTMVRDSCMSGFLGGILMFVGPCPYQCYEGQVTIQT